MYRNNMFKVLVISVCAVVLLAQPSYAANYAFPVIGDATYSNDYYAPRANGIHQATDIIADKMQKIVSRTDGTITFVGYPQPSWGYAVIVKADNGYEYWYLHINNDTPGTDDGSANPMYVYGPDIVQGKRVVKGQLLGFIGDSGNAEETVSHLHLEIVKPNGDRVNPYDGLINNSYHIDKPTLDYPISEDEIIPSSTRFTGGYTIALGDIDNDTEDELITGPGEGGRQLKTLEKDGTLISVFEPNGPSFYGGVDVASGDIDGDGQDEIITGAGRGGRYVKVF